jgi:hypothetical protein
MAQVVSPAIVIEELEKLRSDSGNKTKLGLNALVKEVKRLRFANALAKSSNTNPHSEPPPLSQECPSTLATPHAEPSADDNTASGASGAEKKKCRVPLIVLSRETLTKHLKWGMEGITQCQRKVARWYCMTWT